MLNRNRAEEEDRLRREMQQAREAFERARCEHEAACKRWRHARCRQSRWAPRIQETSSHYRAALEKYIVALRNLSDFFFEALRR